MNSSGIKRGLAATAISALAVTGIPFIATSAHAVPIEDQASGVDLVSQFTQGASIRPDGQDSTVRLEAAADETVNFITFFVEPRTAGDDGDLGTDDDVVGARQVIGTTERNDDGGFAFEWAGAAAYVNQTVTIYAVSTDEDGVFVDDEGTQLEDAEGNPFTGTLAAGQNEDEFPEGSQVDQRNGVEVNFDDSINITNGSRKGVYQSPFAADGQYVGVTGTTSDTSQGSDILLGYYNGDDIAGTAVAAGEQSTINEPASANASSTTFQGVLDIEGYQYSTTGGEDQILIGAGIPGESDDVEGFTLYRQELGSVTAVAENTNSTPGQPAEVVVTVLDTEGNPIAGARVYPSNPDALDPEADAFEYTDANGQATFEQVDGTTFYYVNNTSATGYQASLGDERSENVTATPINPVATTLTGDSDDGNAFDFDEYTDGEITIQVEDQAGNPVDVGDTREVRYYFRVTPFDGEPATIFYPTGAPQNGGDVAAPIVDEDGETRYIARLPEDGESGTYELFASVTGDPGTGTGAIPFREVLEFKAGQAEITFDEDTEVALAGESETVDGQLELEDGTGLPNRDIRLTYAGNGDAGFVPASGSTTSTTPTRTVETGADGSFSVVLRDRSATPQTTETGTITAETVDANLGEFTLDQDDAQAEATQDVTFAQGTAPAGATVEISELTEGNDLGKPGVAESGTVTVENANGTPVANQIVTLAVDGASFFTNGQYEGDEEAGDEVGNLVSLGQTLQVVTDEDGVATFMVAVERSEEFDDDGLAEDIVTATAGSISDTEDVDYSSAKPLNGGAVQLVVSPAAEQEGPTNPAPVGNDVAFDVFTTDQFGNRVGGVEVTITEDGDDATLGGDASAANGFQVVSDFRSEGDFTLTSTDDDTVTVTATWDDAPTTEFAADGEDAGSALDQVTGEETLTDSETVTFSNVVITDETVTLTSSPEGTVRPGTAVTETVTVRDEDGNPVPGVTVRFTQNGPGDTNETVDRVTNAQGQAFYVVTSSTEGTANITAVVETGDTPVVLTDQVRFQNARKAAISPSIRILNQSDRDTLFGYNLVQVRAPKADGARVDLFRVKNGVAKRVKSKTMNGRGFVQFKRADLNGPKKTFYYAVVRETEDTLRGRTPTKGRA